MSFGWFTRLFSFKREPNTREEEEEDGWVNNNDLEMGVDEEEDNYVGNGIKSETLFGDDEGMEGDTALETPNQSIQTVHVQSSSVPEAGFVKDEQNDTQEEESNKPCLTDCETELKPEVLYKCPFCFLVYAEADGFAKHLAVHREEIDLKEPPSSNSKMTPQMAPCAILLSRCDSMKSSPMSLETAEEIKPNFVKEEAMKVPISLSRLTTSSGMAMASTSNSAPRRATSSRAPQSCTICSRKFFLSCNLQQHLLTHGNTKEKSFKSKCPHCPRIFTHSGNLNSHIRSHIGQRPFHCGRCSKSFCRSDHLRAHVRTHAGERKRPYSCSKCKERFISKLSLEGHMLLQHWDDNGKVKPSKQVKAKMENVNSQDQAQHPLALPHCWVALTRCDQSFLNSESSSDKKHSLGHGQSPSIQKVGVKRKATGSLSGRNKPFQCLLCPKSFSCSLYLQFHSYTHTKEKNFKCPLCPKSFSQPGNVNLHIRTHTQEKPYKCGTCSRTFTQLSHLQHHIPTHQQDKPHKCPTCSKSFAQVFNLKAHMFSHGGQRPYQCPTCPRAFIQRGKLNDHIRSHTGERPFQCPICPKSYASSRSLTIHSRRHAGNFAYQCPRCSMRFATRAGVNRHIGRTHR